jgi:hypothetical protein
MAKSETTTNGKKQETKNGKTTTKKVTEVKKGSSFFGRVIYLSVIVGLTSFFVMMAPYISINVSNPINATSIE